GLVDGRGILQVLLQVFHLAGRLSLCVEVIVVGEADLFQVVGPFLPLGRLLHAAAAQKDDSDHGYQGDAHDTLRNAWHGWTPRCCCLTRPSPRWGRGETISERPPVAAIWRFSDRCGYTPRTRRGTCGSPA